MKTKFKQTEIGKIPEDWAVKEFQEVGQINMGQSPKSVTYNDIGEGLPFYQGRKDFGRKYPTVSTYCTDPKKIAQKGDTLLTVRAPVGDVNMANEECCIGRGVSALRLNNGNNDFLYYLMRYYEPKWRNLETGTIFGAIKKDDLRYLKIPLPSNEKQRRIASILSSLDDKIELNNEMNSTLEEMAQAIFKSWFVDFEPFKDGEFEYNEEVGKEIPKGWEVKPIDEIADFLNGLALQKYPPKDENYLPVIKIRELRQGVTESSDRASPDIDKRYTVDDGDILFSWSGSLEVCIWCGGKGALNQHLFKVTSKTYPKWFYYQWIKIYLPKFRHIAKGKATTMGHIRRHHLSETYVIVPSHEVMEKVNETMNPLIETTINNNIESRQLASLRDALLPKLLSGEIRVNDLKRDATEEASA